VKDFIQQKENNTIIAIAIRKRPILIILFAKKIENISEGILIRANNRKSCILLSLTLLILEKIFFIFCNIILRMQLYIFFFI
jgi:hypothetical protein